MTQRMLSLTTEGFSTTTELADTLVRGTGISFRQAHDIVAHTVLRAIAENKTADQITAEMVQEAAIESIGVKLNITNEDILLALNPKENVVRRDVVGGPAPREVRRAIEGQWQKIRSQESRLTNRHKSIDSAYRKLDTAAARILKSAN
jgi:argininosuccinate lyase